MSRYHIANEHFEIFVGWSPSKQTFFAQVWPIDDETNHDGPLLWIGMTHDEIRSLDVLRTHLRPYIRIPDDVAFSLNIDYATSNPHAALQDLLCRIEAAA